MQPIKPLVDIKHTDPNIQESEGMPRLLLRRHVRLYIRGSKGNSCYWIGKSVLTSAVIVCSSLLFWSALKSAAVRCCWKFIRAYASERVRFGNLNKECYKPFSGSVIVNLNKSNKMYDNNAVCQ